MKKAMTNIMIGSLQSPAILNDDLDDYTSFYWIMIVPRFIPQITSSIY